MLCRAIRKTLQYIVCQLEIIQEKQEAIMSNQDELDARGARVEALVNRQSTDLADIRALVEDLKAQIAAGTGPEALDFSKIDAKLDKAEANETSFDDVTPAPVEPPADGGDVPAPPADGGDVPPADGGDVPPAEPPAEPAV